MEQALFSPPLSKQRVDYAVQHIKESCALSLVCVLGFVLPYKLILRFEFNFWLCSRWILDVALEVYWNLC